MIIDSVNLKRRHEIFWLIFFCLLLSILTIYGYGFFGLCLCLFLIVLVTIKEVESIFLSWLLLFSLFSTLPFVFIGKRPLLTFDRGIIGLLLFYLISQALINKRKLLPISKSEWVLIGFLIVIAYSNMKTQSEFNQIGQTFDTFIIPVAIYFISKNLIKNDIQFNRLINVIVILGIYLSGMGIYEHFSSIDVFPTRWGLTASGWLRANGPYEQDIAFGVNVVICFFAVLYRYITSKKKDMGVLIIKKIIFFLIMLCLVLAIFLCYYRAIWISFLFGLMIWFFLRNVGIRRRALIFFIFSILITFFYFSKPDFNKIMHNNFVQKRVLYYGSIQDRFAKYDIALNEFRKDPITGVGLYNLTRIRRVIGGAHNTFLSFLAETGIIGFSILIFLIILIFHKSLKNLKYSKTIDDREFSIIFLCILIAYFLPWISDNIGYYHEINKLFFAILGITFGKFEKKYLTNLDYS